MTEAYSSTLEGCRCVGNTPTHHHRSSATHWEYPQLQCFLEWELVTSGLKANFNLLFYFVNKVLLNSTANQFSSTLSITGLVVQKESWIMLTETTWPQNLKCLLSELFYFFFTFWVLGRKVCCSLILRLAVFTCVPKEVFLVRTRTYTLKHTYTYTQLHDHSLVHGLLNNI